MTTTIEEVTATAIKCGATNSIRLDPIATLQLGKYIAFDPEQLQAFAQHYIEVGEKKQREKDVQVCLSKHANGNYKNDTRDDCAEAIRNNTGE